MVKKTTAATLEHQPTPALGDLDEQGLERLPDFGEPSRDERLAELDERSERLNGHSPEGVRPSDRCKFPSPLGIGCTFAKHETGLHSWTPEPVHEPIPGTEQPMLPGTPEPEQNDYSVPLESAFAGKDLIAAPGLRAIAERLIADDNSLEHLIGVEIRYFWRRRGGTQGGNPRYGAVKRPGMYEAYFTGGKVVYLVALASDHIREARFSDKQIEACIYSQLVKTDVDPDDHDAYRIVGVDFSGTVRELEKFGAWSPDLREMHAHVAKLPLEQAIDDAGTDEGEDEE